MYWKHLWSIMIYIFVPFLADYDQNHKQMINLKKLLGCSQLQIIQIFVIVPEVVPYLFLTKRAARLCVLWIECPLSVFEYEDPMRNIHIFKLWSN